MIDPETYTNIPGRMRICEEKFTRLRPDISWDGGITGKVATVLGLARFSRDKAEDALYDGDANPAVLLSTSPVFIAAYASELDCIVMLRFDDWVAEAFGLSVGARLISTNLYVRSPDFDSDLVPGPGNKGRWQGVLPMIADLLSDDRSRLDTLKAKFPEELWARVTKLGKSYRINYPDVSRCGTQF